MIKRLQAWLSIGASILLTAPQLKADTSTEDQSIRVLIVDGFSNHDWQATTKAIQSILSYDPEFDIDVSTVPPVTSEEWQHWNPPFTNYDVVIQNTNDISKKGAWTEAAKQAFESYIHNGGSMLALHSANNAFREWEAYNQMIGLGWRKKDFGFHSGRSSNSDSNR